MSKGSNPRPFSVTQDEYNNRWDAIFGTDLKKSNAECYFRKCNEDAFAEDGVPVNLSRMTVCPACGNKRCPHASDHALECTDSNEPGQVGSNYNKEAK